MIYLVTYNHDYNESVEAFRTREEAIASITDAFEPEAEPDTKEFWEEVMEIYEAGNWKGFQFLQLDPETLKITECDHDNGN